MAANNNTWRARWISSRAPLLLTAAVLLAYSNSFSDGFTLDSKQAILADARVHEVSAQNLGNIFEHTYWWPYDESGLYRPLTTLSYLFNYSVLGNAGRPAGYHAINLLLHLANTLLVYALAGRLTRYALPVALLWAVHPVLTESVTNIVGRADLLAALGMLGAIWFYVAKPRGWLWGVAAATAVGVFSKESAVVLPALLPLFLRDRRRLIAGIGATTIPIAAMLAQRASVLASSMSRHVPFTDNPIAGVDFVTARLTALSVLGRYVWLSIWPARLSADYSYAQIAPSPNWLALVTVAAVIAAGIRWNRTALAFAAVALLPVSNLLFPIGTIMAERFLYLPALAFTACLAPLWRWPADRVALCVLAALFAARTWARNADWRDDRTMAESLVQTSPASYKGHRLLAAVLFEAHAAPERVLDEAAKSLAPLDPLPDAENSAETWRLAGGYYAAAGQHQRSAEILERCLRIVEADRQRVPDAVYPGAADVLETLASDYLALQRFDEAAVTLMTGQLTTGDLSFRNRLLELYRGVDGAIVPGPAGPAINPQNPVVHGNLCQAMARTGKTAEMAAYGCKN